MSTVADIFSGWRSAGRAGLMPFLTAGYPSLDATVASLHAFERELGPTIVELGFPFSDPIADGPVIAASMHEALKAGVTPERIFERVRSIRADTGHALIAMVSISIVDRLGPEPFIAEAAAAGMNGLIIPDLDFCPGGATTADSAGRFAELAERHELSFTLLVAPTATPERVKDVVGACRGWIYLLARVGITGERRRLPDVAPRVQAIRALSDLPIAVGFGISSAEHVAAATAHADAAIVGSAIVRAMHQGEPDEAAAAVVRELAGGLRATPAA